MTCRRPFWPTSRFSSPSTATPASTGANRPTQQITAPEIGLSRNRSASHTHTHMPHAPQPCSLLACDPLDRTSQPRPHISHHRRLTVHHRGASRITRMPQIRDSGHEMTLLLVRRPMSRAPASSTQTPQTTQSTGTSHNPAAHDPTPSLCPTHAHATCHMHPPHAHAHSTFTPPTMLCHHPHPRSMHTAPRPCLYRRLSLNTPRPLTI